MKNIQTIEEYVLETVHTTKIEKHIVNDMPSL